MHSTTHTSNAGSQFRTIERTLVRPRLQANLREAKFKRNQLLAAPAPTVRRIGFEVPGAITDDFTAKVFLGQATERVEAIESWLGAIDALETDLTTLGLPPIAVLPTALWRHLTGIAHVHRFENFGKDGTVPAQPLGMFANLKLHLDTLSTLDLVAKLWPQYHDSIATGIRVTPYFPQAPDHFQQNLLRLMATKWPATAYAAHIAAVPEAITVSRKEVLNAHIAANLVAPKAPVPTPDQDPILYTMSPDGRLVALIDYFGHFPEEEKLVERAQAWYAQTQATRRR